ncbi:uncharacterized protein V6R79_003120 [Siganus canaliculatus]
MKAATVTHRNKQRKMQSDAAAQRHKKLQSQTRARVHSGGRGLTLPGAGKCVGAFKTQRRREQNNNNNNNNNRTESIHRPINTMKLTEPED